MFGFSFTFMTIFHYLPQLQFENNASNGKFGDELNGALKNPRPSSKYFQKIFSDENGCENIWKIFAPRRAAHTKKSFSSFFKGRI